MKKLFAILLAVCSLLNIACKKEKVGIDGPAFSYDEILVVENDELVLAHEYVLNFPAQGGAVDVKIVSPGMYYSRPLVLSNQFVVELLDDISEDPESHLYDYVEQEMLNGKIKVSPRYLQTLRITAEQNKQSASRSSKLDIQTGGRLECSRAIITLRQAGIK